MNSRVTFTARGSWTPEARAMRNDMTFGYGRVFCQAVRPAPSPRVRAYLLGHSLEMYLKSFLLREGIDIKQLKSREFGHNLVALLEAARARGLENWVPVTSQLASDVAALCEVYPETLRYFELKQIFNQRHIPELGRLYRFARRLDRSIEQHIQHGA